MRTQAKCTFLDSETQPMDWGELAMLNTPFEPSDLTLCSLSYLRKNSKKQWGPRPISEDSIWREFTIYWRSTETTPRKFSPNSKDGTKSIFSESSQMIFCTKRTKRQRRSSWLFTRGTQEWPQRNSSRNISKKSTLGSWDWSISFRTRNESWLLFTARFKFTMTTKNLLLDRKRSLRNTQKFNSIFLNKNLKPIKKYPSQKK